MITTYKKTFSSPSLRIAVFGASGQIGQRLVAEGVRRSHQMTAVSRSQPALGVHDDRVSLVHHDVERGDGLSEITKQQDVVISALRPRDGQEHKLLGLTQNVVLAANATRTRFIIVGGAAPLTLPDDPGHTVLTAPGFLPDAYIDIARACQQQHDWALPRLGKLGTYISPPATLVPGERTGNYRQSQRVLLMDDQGESRISIEDFAVALFDEVQRPAHTGTPFTVAY